MGKTKPSTTKKAGGGDKGTSSSSSTTSGSNRKRGSGSTTNKPPPLDQYMKPIIGIALAFLGYHVFRGMVAKEIKRVDIAGESLTTGSELELREVLFGEGDPNSATSIAHTNYAVLCYPESALFPISSVFQDSANDGSVPNLQYRIIDCDTPMTFSKDQKTIMERFPNLDKKNRPIVFVSGSIGQPKQVPSKFLKTGSMLTKALKNLVEPRAVKLETTQDLRSKCLDKDVCAVILKGSSKASPAYVKDAIQKLVVEYPKVTFASLDSSVLYLKGVEAELLPELVPGMPRFVVFQKTSGTTDKSKLDSERLKTTATVLDVSVGYGPMSNLVASVMSGSADMKKVSTTPTIKTRTKKLEKEDNAKRQRRSNKNKKFEGDSDAGSSSSSSSYSGDNDGSPEGRKAERERRRAEHRKNNPNYKEKTPEEIKEIERKRRVRMEEEAQKWNMDVEADGDGSDGGEQNMDEEEDWDQDDLDNDEDDLDGDDEDGEDVLDLD